MKQNIKDLVRREIAGKGFSRRDFIKGTGALIVSCSMTGVVEMMMPQDASADFSTLVDPSNISSWLAIAKDGSVTVFHGKVDNGQGVSTAFRQIVADELDVSIDRVRCVVGDTALTVDQVGATGSTGLRLGSPPVRVACAEAKLTLLEMASRELGAPVDELTVQDGVISVRGVASKKVSYGELIGGRDFSGRLEWNKEIGRTLAVKGRAKLKSPDKFTVVGKPIPREDIPPIVFGQDHYVADVRLPGMVLASTDKVKK